MLIETFVLNESGIFAGHKSGNIYKDFYCEELIGTRLIKENRFYPILLISEIAGFDYILFLDRGRPDKLVFWTIDNLRNNKSTQGLCPIIEIAYFAEATRSCNEFIACIDHVIKQLEGTLTEETWQLFNIKQIRHLIAEDRKKAYQSSFLGERGPKMSLLAAMTCNTYSCSEKFESRLIEFASTFLEPVQHELLIKAYSILDQRLKGDKVPPFWLGIARYCLLRELFCVVTGRHIAVNPFSVEMLVSASTTMVHPSARVITYQLAHSRLMFEVRGHAWLDETTQLIFDNLLCVEMPAFTKWGNISHLITTEVILHQIKASRITSEHEASKQALPRINICTFTHPNNLGHILWNEYSGYVELAEILDQINLQADALFYVYDLDADNQFANKSTKEVVMPVLMSGLKAYGTKLNTIHYNSFPPKHTSLSLTEHQSQHCSFKFPIMSQSLRSAFIEHFSKHDTATSFRIFVNIRSHNKAHTNIDECIKCLLASLGKSEKLAHMHKQVPFVFDLEFANEDETVHRIRDLVAKNEYEYTLHHRIPLDVLCKVVSSSTICIAPIGSGAVLSTWMYNKSTILHGDQMHMRQLNWWGKVAPCDKIYPIPSSAIFDLSDNSYSNYSINAEAYAHTVLQAINACCQDHQSY